MQVVGARPTPWDATGDANNETRGSFSNANDQAATYISPAVKLERLKEQLQAALSSKAQAAGGIEVKGSAADVVSLKAQIAALEAEMRKSAKTQ